MKPPRPTEALRRELAEADFERRVEAGECERTAAEVAKVLGCDVSYVYQLERSALAKLRRSMVLREVAE